MKNFNHVGSSLDCELKTENINGKRIYETPNGDKYISITSLLSNLSKASIQKWRERVGEDEARKITTQASRRGTSVHNICESYIQNEDGYLEGELPNVVDMFQSIEPLLNRIDNIHVVEGSMWSDHLKLAGRTDLIGEFDNRLSVIDYKTSNKKKTWQMCHQYFMQGAFYAVAYEERTGIPVDTIVIIMAVENEQPLLFVEKRDDWIEPLKEVITKYS
jgi:genome maintenance exonuclease 1